ncbi:MAG: sialidase family protein [Eubacteriales bacterium]|jgi:sialidase-1
MKKIGRQTLYIQADEQNPRSGEGCFIRLKDGSILHAYNRFRGGDGDDYDSADIAGIKSSDEGESWTEPFILIKKDEGATNLMCPSLIRMKNGDIGMIYVRKYPGAEGEDVLDTVMFTRSFDEGESWSEGADILGERGYVVIENDHVITLENGRILIPFNRHSETKDGKIKFIYRGRMAFLASDDDGKSWKQICDNYSHPFAEYSRTGLQETTVFQESSGRLRAYSRTDTLCQYESVSDDFGVSWTVPRPNTFFSSPASPMLVRKIDDLVLAIFNPIPNYTTRKTTRFAGRTPFVMAISRDDGNSFGDIYILEDDPDLGYCYPSIFDGGDYILVAYYVLEGKDRNLDSNKIIKIQKSEL